MKPHASLRRPSRPLPAVQRTFPIETSRTASRAHGRHASGGADAGAIIAGAKNYARAREGRPARYTIEAARWLLQSRWRDAGLVFAQMGENRSCC